MLHLGDDGMVNIPVWKTGLQCTEIHDSGDLIHCAIAFIGYFPHHPNSKVYGLNRKSFQ